ncbi:MAG: Gfo/Idh/MocA family oxidoreductase [Bryobacteraceae bacterium]|jgi:predicted dehydrogenase
MEDRRSFLKNSAGTALAASAMLNLQRSAMGANERINLALIGGRNQGRGVALRTIRQGGHFKTFCDLDDAILAKTGAQIAEAQGAKPAFEKDFRRVLDDKDIDAVVIAVPDHWHARMMIMACQAGKDVYCEKPMSQTIHEGHEMRDAARKYNRIVQVGTQRRSGEHFKSAVEYVAAGKIGKVCEIKAWIYQLRPSIGRPPDSDPPAGIDYDMWLGPGPKRPFNPNRFHYNWRFFWDYGNSELGNQGIHVLDVAIWAIQQMRGTENCLPTRVSASGGIYWLDDAKEVPDTQIVTYYYDNLLLSFELRSFAADHLLHQGRAFSGGPGAADFYTAYYGTEGTLVLTNDDWKVYRSDGSVGPEQKATGGSHERNFLDSIKSRKLPNSDVEIGRLSTTLTHLGNISYKLGRDVHFDPKTETFGSDHAADQLLTKQYRAPYELPRV